MSEDSSFVRHEPCSECGSSDGMARYSDGHGHCFVCKAYEGATDEAPKERKERKVSDLIRGEVQALAARRINEETCQHWRYLVGDYDGKRVQIATYCDDEGTPIAQKLRFKDKTFKFIGEPKKVGLFGQHLWRDGGKKVVITEGEIDALSVSQLQNNKWPVVSVPNGAQGAAKTIAKCIEWLSKFEQVIFMFDDDAPGKAAAQECAGLLAPGKAYIATIPGFKDANEALQAGEGSKVIDAIWGAKQYRPDGLVDIDDILEEADKDIEVGRPWCFDTLTKLTYGRRKGEVFTIGAGTGIGKTDFLTQQIEYDVNVLGLRVGVLYLEQKPVETARRIAGKQAGKRFHVPDDGWTREERKAALAKLKGKITFYDSWGCAEWDQVKLKIRFMALSQGIEHFYLDHLTAMADPSNEKESLEQLMKELASLCNELQIVMHLVSHLSTPDGKPHEEGGRVMIRHFKGSRAIGFWSYFMFGMERDQQAEGDAGRITTFRILKDRHTGQATGKVFGLDYDATTGRLFECELPKQGESTGFRDESSGADDDPF